MIGSAVSTMVFLVFVGIMYFWVFRLLKRESSNDVPV